MMLSSSAVDRVSEIQTPTTARLIAYASYAHRWDSRTWLATCITCERLGEADVQVEVSEPQMQDSAAGPVHDVCQQDDDQDHDHQPEEEHDDPGDDVPSYSSRSSHGLQLPGAARIIRNGRGAERLGGRTTRARRTESFRNGRQ